MCFKCSRCGKIWNLNIFRACPVCGSDSAPWSCHSRSLNLCPRCGWPKFACRCKYK